MFCVKQIEPLERDIKAKKLRILELEVSLETLLKQRSFRGNPTRTLPTSCNFFSTHWHVLTHRCHHGIIARQH